MDQDGDVSAVFEEYGEEGDWNLLMTWRVANYAGLLR